MKPEQAKALQALREPFKPEQIGKLPKPTKKENPKGHCNVCGGWHGLPAVHLDYVGHAAVTDRLLTVDPEWTWEPVAFGPNGEPLITNDGLWIKLTIAGVTRYGFGDSTMGKGVKEMIGDAIRNAAMRFGVALDLWAKEDLKADGEAGPHAAGPAPTSTDGRRTDAQNRKMRAVIADLDKSGMQPDGADNWAEYAKRWIFTEFGRESSKDLTKAEAGKLIDHLEAQAIPFG